MDTMTIRIAAGILALIVLALIVRRRRRSAE
ncbi:MAG: LPXTG cell wall anchor domain-containing protein [Terriglobia bacterium]